MNDLDHMRQLIQLIEVTQSEAIDNPQDWKSHRDIAELILQHTKNIQLARDFVALEDEFVTQDDMQSSGLSAMGFDPFLEDRDRVNQILSTNNVPFKVLKMQHNDQYETQYQILQSA